MYPLITFIFLFLKELTFFFRNFHFENDFFKVWSVDMSEAWIHNSVNTGDSVF